MGCPIKWGPCATFGKWHFWTLFWKSWRNTNTARWSDRWHRIWDRERENRKFHFGCAGVTPQELDGLEEVCTKRIKLHCTVDKSVMFRKAHFWSYDKFFKINTKFQKILSIVFSERLNIANINSYTIQNGSQRFQYWDKHSQNTNFIFMKWNCDI